MFDNLPFLRAIEVLGAVQRIYRETKHLDSLTFLRQRHDSPDLFIAGSLNVRPERDKEADTAFDDLITIVKAGRIAAGQCENPRLPGSCQHRRRAIGLAWSSLLRMPQNGRAEFNRRHC